MRDTKRPPPRQPRAAAKRAAILAAAEALLAHTPPAALTTKAVAEAAGVPIGSVYRYFANAEGLLEALFADYNRSTREALAEVLASPSADWRSDLRRLMSVIRRMHDAHPTYGALMRHVEADGPSDDAAASAIALHWDERLPSAAAARVSAMAVDIVEAGERRLHAVPTAERDGVWAEVVRAVEAYLATWLD